MNYQEQLQEKNWKVKRKEILTRDNSKCQNCLNEQIIKNSIPALLIGGKLNTTSYTSINLTNGKYENSFILSKTYTHSNNLNSICFFSRIESKNIVIGILKKTIPVDQNLKYTVSLETFEKNNWDTFSYKFFNIENANQYLNSNDINSFEWEYVLNLHIHHTYYKENLLAWEYPNEALLTLCWNCHEKLHVNSKIPVYDKFDNLIENRLLCLRCYGAGWFPKFNHVENGICFRCRGTRFEPR